MALDSCLKTTAVYVLQWNVPWVCRRKANNNFLIEFYGINNSSIHDGHTWGYWHSSQVMQPQQLFEIGTKTKLVRIEDITPGQTIQPSSVWSIQLCNIWLHIVFFLLHQEASWCLHTHNNGKTSYSSPTNDLRHEGVCGQFDWVRFLVVCFLYKTNPNPRKTSCCGKKWPKCQF